MKEKFIQLARKRKRNKSLCTSSYKNVSSLYIGTDDYKPADWQNPEDKITISGSNLLLNHAHTKADLQPNDYCCRGNIKGSNDSGNQRSQTVLCVLLEHALRALFKSCRCNNNCKAVGLGCRLCAPAILAHVCAAVQSAKGLSEENYRSEGGVNNKYALRQSHRWSHRSQRAKTTIVTWQ